jgi:hypothetical protein
MFVEMRPGGGGSYHGGGGGGGGSFGGGGGSFGGPGSYTGGGGGSMSPGGALVLLIVFGVIFGLVWLQRRRARFGPRTDQFDPMAGARPSAPLDVLRARDPALTEQSIVEHVRPMADMLRQAWCGGDMRPARPFVSDGVYSRFQVQLALARQENRRNVMGDARVLYTSIEAVQDANPLDVVHVRLTAEARDTEVPWQARDDEIQVALSRTQVAPYTEIWSLVRRAGAQTKPQGFAVGRACPGCGAPLDQGEVIKCRYCGALVCSGEHDWVLAEITQLEEWRPRMVPPPGVDALRTRDPGVAAEVLEDRASYLFWKWVEAARGNSPVPLRKAATPAFIASGGRAEWARGASDVAVGGADVARCVVGAPDGYDHVDVLVRWSARFGGSRDHTPSQCVIRMARKPGVQSRPSMTALMCQACGAPVTDSDSTRCQACGAELAAGDQAWILEAVLSPGEAGV